MTSVTHAIGAEVSDQISKCICSEKVLQDLANALHSAKLCTSRESGQGMKATSAPLESLQQCEKPSCFNVFQCVSMCFMTSTMKGAHLIILLNSVSVHASTPVSNCCQHLSYSEYLTILTWGENCTLWQYDNDLFWDFSLFFLLSLFFQVFSRSTSPQLPQREDT